MNRFVVCIVAAALFCVPAEAARAGTLDGILASYVSGNKGTDVTVKTADGRTRRLWFDNLKKPLFEGKQLPWCPDFPCDGWPKQLVIGKTHVRVTYVQVRVEAETIQTPTRIDLLH